MDDFYLAREVELEKNLGQIEDPIEKIDELISFIISVRSSLSPRVEGRIKDALPLCRSHNYEKGLFSLYTHLAFYYLMNSDYPSGKSYLDKAGQLDWSRFINSSEHMYNYHAHGLFYHFTGDRMLAMEYFENALVLARSLKNLNFTCQMLNNLSLYYLDDGDYAKAEKVLLEAFSLIDPTLNPFPAIKILDNLGKLYIFMGDYERARGYLDSGLTYAREKEIEYMIPPLNLNFGRLHEKMEEYEAAEEYLRKAYEGNGDTFFVDEIPLELIRFLFARSRKEEAKELAARTIDDFNRKGMNGSLDQVYHILDEYDI